MSYLRVILAMFFLIHFSLVFAECDPEFEDCDRPPTAEEIAQHKAEAAAEAKAKLPFKFVEVREVNLKKDEIIKHAASYIAENFKSAKKVIELNDPVQGKIIGNVILADTEAGFFDAFHVIEATIIIEAKDGRFRFKAIYLG